MLLIDSQQDFTAEKTAESFPQFPDNIANLLELCRTEGIEMVRLRACFKPDMSRWMLKYRLRRRIPCIHGINRVEELALCLGETCLLASSGARPLRVSFLC